MSAKQNTSLPLVRQVADFGCSPQGETFSIPPLREVSPVGRRRMFVCALVCVFLAFPLAAFAAPIVPCGDQTNPTTGAVLNPCTFNHFLVGIKNIIDFLLMITGSIAAIIFAYAGFLVLTAGADEGKVKQAKELSWSVVKGFALMLSAWLLVKLVLAGLGVQPDFILLQ